MNKEDELNHKTEIQDAKIVHSGSGNIYGFGSFVPTPSIPINGSNLPNPHSGFVGRQEEIATVLEALSSRAWIVTIDGMGGIGKTTLALEVSYKCKNSDFKLNKIPKFTGFIWMSARDKPDFSLDDVTQTILYVLSPYEERTKNLSSSEQLNLAKRLLSSEPRLLIIDNFETVSDEPLHRFLRDLPNPSKVIITSRHHIKTGERVVTVGGLEEEDAVSLLQLEAIKLQIPINNQDTDRLTIIARKTYGIPIVLQWVMESVYNGKTLESVLSSLEQATADDIFDYMYELSLSTLDSETRSIFRSMSLLPTWARIETIEAINEGIAAVQDRVSQLVTRSLLEDNRNLAENHRRYRLASFTRYLATKELANAENKGNDNIQSGLHYYLSSLNKLKSNNALAKQYLDEEFVNLDNIIGVAASRNNDNLLKICIEIFAEIIKIDSQKGEDILDRFTKLLSKLKNPYLVEAIEGLYFEQLRTFLPNSIPSIRGFVARNDYLTELRESYQNGARCFVLHGIGGVGKTALALRFANEIADDYKAKIFVDMKGTSENPITASDAMFIIVRTFEPQIAADIPPSQLEGLFLSFVQRQPTLIILDNAESEAQVAPLINARDACVLISSRNNIWLPSGETIRLRAMSPEDAEELLFSIAGKEKFEGRAGELSELAGYLPMALKPLAKLLKKEFMTIARILKDYADKKKLLYITDTEHDNLSVEASFALSYDALTDELKKHWRSLAVFPADFESNVASTVFGLEFEDGWNILEQLYDYSLIEKDAKSTAEQPRFILHDLARVFTDAKLSDERFDAQLRHAFYYASILQTAEEMQRNNKENYFINALKLIDTEWSNITAGQKWTASFVEQNDEAANLCIYYSGYAHNFVTLRLHPRENIDWLEAGLTAARKLNNRRYEANNLGNLGSAYKNLGEYRKAIEYHEQSLEIFRELGDRFGEGANLGNLGNAYASLGNYRKAIEYQERSLIIKREIGDRFGEGNSLGNLGSAYNSLGEYRKAIEYHEQALQISLEVGDRLGEGNHLRDLGNAYNSLGDYRKAIRYQEQALSISREIGDQLGEGNGLADLGLVYNSIGENEKACSLWKEAETIFEAINSPSINIVRQWIEKGCN